MGGRRTILLLFAVSFLLAACGETDKSDIREDATTSSETQEQRESNESGEAALPQEISEPRKPEDTDAIAASQDTAQAYSRALTDALVWERIKANCGATFLYPIGKTFRQTEAESAGTGRGELMYCFIPGKGEAAYENWPLADVLLFSGPILSENAKCTAIAYDFKYAAPGWNGETAFSKEDVLRAGGDVKWIEREGSEPACLEYTFDGLQMRVYTDDDGAGILRDRNVLLKEQSAEKLFGLQDIDIKQDLIAAEKGKVGTLLYDYVDCLGKTQEEITENLPGNYKFNVNGSMRELDDNIEYIFFEGYCYGINIPVEVAFPDLGNESGFEYVKDLDMPFSYQLSTPGSTWYKIEFEEFVIYIMADESMNILADDQVVIQRR